MTLSSVDLYRYSLPLTDRLRVGRHEISEREGLLVRVHSEERRVGWGEAAPLPGFSDDTLNDVVASARSLARRLADTTVSPREDLDGILQGLPLEQECPASLQFAVESAVVHLVAQARGESPATVLGGSRDTIMLNALIARPLEDGEEQAAALRDAGYEAVKIKVGQAPVEEEAECIRALHQVLGADVSLRLDANRAWSLEEAVTFGEALGDVPVAYVEEPLADPAKLSALAADTSLPIALDETTREREAGVLDEASFIAAVVLKPTLLGGIAATRRWADRAEGNDVLAVMSAAYESGVGLRMLAAIAASLPAIPVGLSTYNRLAADVLTPPLSMNGPTVSVTELYASRVDLEGSLLDSAQVSL